jgi:hypothetical protein
MRAEVAVAFTPDSRGDYADALTVDTSRGRFEVHLQAARSRPQLSLPDRFQVWFGLAGGYVHVWWVVRKHICMHVTYSLQRSMLVFLHAPTYMLLLQHPASLECIEQMIIQ